MRIFLIVCYCLDVYLLVIDVIKTVIINGMELVALVGIAILHQSCSTDSADINTRLVLNDTSSISPMHGGFLQTYLQIYLRNYSTYSMDIFREMCCRIAILVIMIAFTCFQPIHVAHIRV